MSLLKILLKTIVTDTHLLLLLVKAAVTLMLSFQGLVPESAGCEPLDSGVRVSLALNQCKLVLVRLLRRCHREVPDLGLTIFFLLTKTKWTTILRIPWSIALDLRFWDLYLLLGVTYLLHPSQIFKTHILGNAVRRNAWRRLTQTSSMQLSFLSCLGSLWFSQLMLVVPCCLIDLSRCRNVVWANDIVADVDFDEPSWSMALGALFGLRSFLAWLYLDLLLLLSRRVDHYTRIPNNVCNVLALVVDMVMTRSSSCLRLWVPHDRLYLRSWRELNCCWWSDVHVGWGTLYSFDVIPRDHDLATRLGNLFQIRAHE